MIKRELSFKMTDIKDMHDNEVEDLRELFGDNLTLYRGDGPPPPRINPMEKLEMDMLAEYYKLPEQGDTITDEYGPPDCQGIQDMIRMVREHGELPDYDNEALTLNSSDSSEQAAIELVKSELNPEVPEFVPVSNNINISSLKPHEANSLADELKKKLRSMQKRERNVAMASLTKLYSVYNTPKVGPSTEPSEPNILLTPAYFKPEEESPKAEQVKPEEPVIEVDLHAQKESINKVTNWLSHPKKKEAPTKPTLQLKPFTYKKKEPSPSSVVESPHSKDSPSQVPASPVKDSSSSNEQSSTSSALRSANAARWLDHFNKLTQERDKAREREQDKTIWDKAARQMKEKEELLKKKREGKQ